MAKSFVLVNGPTLAEAIEHAVAEIWTDGDTVYGEIRIPGKAGSDQQA